MSEQAAENTEEGAAPEAKKKGGKLPLIIIVALVLAGGGFFAMKGKGGAKVKPKIEMGTTETLGEFTVNLSGGATYCRTEIAVALKKGFEKKSLEECLPAIKDAVVTTLRETSPDDVKSTEGLDLLKQTMCERINTAIEAAEPKKDAPKEGPPAAADGDKKDGEKKDGEKKDGDKKAPDKKVKPDAAQTAAQSGKHELHKFPNGWDSEEGPVLRVYFPSFATQ